MTPAQLSVAFFLQMFVIIAVCRAVGWAAKRFLGQPQVVGEMIAGVILGPSLFGLLAPDLQHMLFPKESKTVLYVGAQMGVGLYMFLVGTTFNSAHFKSNAKSAAAVSLSGMAAPFLVAFAIAPWLLSLNLFGKGITGLQAALFMGAAISITAFPMLARIIHERGLSKTPCWPSCWPLSAAAPWWRSRLSSAAAPSCCSWSPWGPSCWPHWAAWPSAKAS
jgi:Kef-type K+ transport system membrane component KefB